MQPMKNVAASAKSGMEKTKATVEEKVEKMTSRDPVEKEEATQKKEAKIAQAEQEKQEARAHNTAAGAHQMSAMPGHGTGSAVGSHPYTGPRTGGTY